MCEKSKQFDDRIQKSNFWAKLEKSQTCVTQKIIVCAFIFLLCI